MLYISLYIYLDEFILHKWPSLDLAHPHKGLPTTLWAPVWCMEHRISEGFWISQSTGEVTDCQYSAIPRVQNSDSWGQSAQKSLWREKPVTQSANVSFLKSAQAAIPWTHGAEGEAAQAAIPWTQRVEGKTSLLSRASFPVYVFKVFSMVFWCHGNVLAFLNLRTDRPPGHTRLTAKGLSLF